MKKYLLIILMIPMHINPPVVYAETQINSEKEKLSYAVGVQLAQNMLRQSIQVDTEAFVQAVRDTLDQSGLKLSAEEMRQVLVNYQQQEMKRLQILSQQNKLEGDKFLAENKTQPGINTTGSGLQYKVVTPGQGVKPTASDTVVVHYRGALLDGKEFDSSYGRGQPVTFKVSGVIPGWQEALALMPVGSKWQVFVPPELAYGEGGALPDIGPNATLVFDVELISIN